MKGALIYVATVLAAIAICAAIVFGLRSVSLATAPSALVSPKPGITCLKVATSDGVAVSCWKD